MTDDQRRDMTPIVLLREAMLKVATLTFCAEKSFECELFLLG